MLPSWRGLALFVGHARRVECVVPSPDTIDDVLLRASSVVAQGRVTEYIEDPLANKPISIWSWASLEGRRVRLGMQWPNSSYGTTVRSILNSTIREDGHGGVVASYTLRTIRPVSLAVFLSGEILAGGFMAAGIGLAATSELGVGLGLLFSGAFAAGVLLWLMALLGPIMAAISREQLHRLMRILQ